MKMTYMIISSVLLFSGLSFASPPPGVDHKAAVNIEINHQNYNFKTEPRLVEVLAPVALQQNWYWPAAKLYRLNSSGLNSNEPEHLREKVLLQLQALQRNVKPALQQELAALQLQIKSWKLAERILIPIDYDLARAQQPFNRRFQPGNYKLQLVSRPVTVLVWGAIEKSLTLTHSGATAVSDYLPSVMRSDFADKAYVYIIQPDGRIIRAGVAAWNQQHLEAMPGAQVFIPFAESWFGADMNSLNKSILALALHWVVE
ncbi:capsule biosynthesis GfcC family protein [Arsukibacterium sp.]|uniref:capsule biosynthesis GfcC family protein n=1 Tax=Arsukibacterium sp. TaxID=1977258 RepID=UPI00299E9A36|nr:capsule biosynthesis GfcC family protein [Arsukibacterium sp.]MDX1538527.1 capsule biosynthesis GfcC family protein [Arsukibacterium sp.]